MNVTASRVLLLDSNRIRRKILRMAWQIWEYNSDRSSICLIGIAEGGYAIAQLLADHLSAISPLKVNILRLEMSKRAPVDTPIKLSGPIEDSSLVLVDDVANSGRTLLYALQPLMKAAPEKVLIAVLVDRKHKSFPLSPDIIGHQVATTIQENISVQFDQGQINAYLD